MITLENIIEKIEYLPPFPQAVTKVMQMMKDPNTSPEEIAEVVKYDQAIATNVLRLCNSSYCGLRRTISNLREAVVFIGMKNLKNIMIISGTQKYFDKENPGYETKKGELWIHALAVSIIAGNIGEKINIKNKDELFIAALLHDIGKLVLNEYVLESCVEISNTIEKEDLTFLDAEKKVLGMNHAEIGAKVLDIWKFPEEIISAVRKHHSAYDENDTDLENMVRIADNLAMMMGYETGVDGLAYNGFSDICRRYDLNRGIMDNIMSDSLEEIVKIETEYRISMEVQ
ncbi:HDOD domain-containing protein [Candidatus Latescibacterota bacterium]